MNWQKLSNVNPPIGQDLFMYDPADKIYFYAKRKGFYIKIAESYRDLNRDDDLMNILYSEFRADEGAGVYWCICKKPNE